MQKTQENIAKVEKELLAAVLYVAQHERSLEWEKKFFNGRMKQSREATGRSSANSESAIRPYHERRIQNSEHTLKEAEEEFQVLKKQYLELNTN